MIRDRRVGDIPVLRRYIGDQLVWEREEPVEYDYRNFDVSAATFISQSGTSKVGYWPDGSVIVVPDGSGNFATYVSNRAVFRAESSSPYFENNISKVIDENRVFGEDVTPDITDFTDDGVWFIGIHRTEGNNLIGFFHAESGWPGPQFDAYRTIGVTYSTDNGLTWSTPEKIIAPDYAKPSTPQHCGVGDGSVVWNPVLGKFVCYYLAHSNFNACMAASDTGAAGTWLKWDGDDFTIDAYNSVTGIGGADVPIGTLTNASGRNFNVFWNSVLQLWVMVYGGWDGAIYMSTSADGIVWVEPFRITATNNGDTTYPSLVGPNGSTAVGVSMKLYHGRNTNQTTLERELVHRNLELTPANEIVLPAPATSQSVYTINTGDSLTVTPTNAPSNLVEAEWRVGSTSGFVTSRDVSLVIPSSSTGSPVSMPLFVRYNYHGVLSEWHQITINIV